LQNSRKITWLYRAPLCAGAVLIAATMMVAAVGAAAAQEATPNAATPEGTPVVLTPEEARFARLGGSLADVLAEYGTPDWTDEGLVGYNSISLGGVDTITMVFYDAAERVRSYLLVYLEQPDDLDDPEAIARVVADVAPRDGQCDDEPLEESNLGDEVYACRSEALVGVFTAEELLDFGLIGDDGSFSYTVDPTDDQFYEIAVRPGTDGPPEPPTPVPTPEPTPRPPLTETYPTVDDILALANGEFEPGEPVSFSGTILEIRPTESGALILMQVVAPDGSGVIVAVENSDDLAGIFPGEVWTVFGIFTGIECDVTGACTPTVHVIELE
jgi:hypothetical protein